MLAFDNKGYKIKLKSRKFCIRKGNVSIKGSFGLGDKVGSSIVYYSIWSQC